MTRRIHIKIADRGWILEKCAKEIAERNPAITYGTDPDPSAAVHYYINYSARSRRVSPVEIAFFTHSEMDEAARRRYFDTAAEVDHCVCMSARYAQELIEHGIPEKKVSIIAPGVDLDAFRPKVRVGVVGRTYHTGRKGEALVAQVMDIPGIEWCFTGSGWPGPSVQVPDGGMPEFYNSLDYVLVPALYEGGPMSVLEGLACGVPIIASDVGWVNEYPHLWFENGNVESLRKVLEDVVAERTGLRDAVTDLTWEKWAQSHIELITGLLPDFTADSIAEASTNSQTRETCIVSHGSEQTTKGGPTTRISNIIACAEEVGEQVHYSFNLPELGVEPQPDVVHVFNSWPLKTAVSQISAAKARGAKVVYSPIALNLSNFVHFNDTLPRIFHEARQPEDAIAGLETVKNLTLPFDGQAPGTPIQGVDGHFDYLRHGVELSDHVIYLSRYEKAFLDSIGAVSEHSTVIQNGVDVETMASGDPHRFRNEFGVNKFVLCVGRIETRKNQAALALAARELDCPLVLIGHVGHQDYFNQVKKWAGRNLVHIDRIEDRDLIASAYKAAACFVLPSWAEGAPLAAIEAGAAGTPLILSNMASEEEYFGEYAKYVHPCDVNRMTELLKTELANPESNQQRCARSQFSVERFGIEAHTRSTLAVYDQMHELRNQESSLITSIPPRPLFDITHLAHALSNKLNLTGVTAVEYSLLHALLEKQPKLEAVLWNSRHNEYISVNAQGVLDGTDSFKATAHDVRDADELTIRQVRASTQAVSPPPQRETSPTAKARKSLVRKVARLAAKMTGRTVANSQLNEDAAANSSQPAEVFFDIKMGVNEVQTPGYPKVTPGGRVFMLGQPWISNERMLDKLCNFVEQNGLRLAVHVPDILYVTDSAAFDDQTRKTFRDNLLKLLSVSDHVITISKQADKEIRDLLKHHRIEMETTRITIGANTELLAADPAVPQEHLPSRFVLYVSSMNSRKRHNFITDVWGDVRRKLKAQGHEDVGLVFVGSPQSGFQKYSDKTFLQQLREKNIFVLSGMGSQELAWLYRNCLFTVYPARSEGWGIPPIESLCFGKPCVVSNSVPSAQETQCPAIVRIGVRDYFQWVETIHSLIVNDPMRQSLEQHALAYRPPSWEDAAERILEIL